MSPSTSKTSVRPSGDTSTDGQVTRSVVNSSVSAAGSTRPSARAGSLPGVSGACWACGAVVPVRRAESSKGRKNRISGPPGRADSTRTSPAARPRGRVAAEGAFMRRVVLLIALGFTLLHTAPFAQVAPAPDPRRGTTLAAGSRAAAVRRREPHRRRRRAGAARRQARLREGRRLARQGGGPADDDRTRSSASRRRPRR